MRKLMFACRRVLSSARLVCVQEDTKIGGCPSTSATPWTLCTRVVVQRARCAELNEPRGSTGRQAQVRGSGGGGRRSKETCPWRNMDALLNKAKGTPLHGCKSNLTLLAQKKKFPESTLQAILREASFRGLCNPRCPKGAAFERTQAI